VIATGVNYRRPSVPRLAELEGRGVWYWATAMEAALCEKAEVALVGGGNSAGQAAVYLAGHAARVYMLVRSGDLSSMSRYLIDRIENTPNIEVLFKTGLYSLRGDRSSGLLGISWRRLHDEKTSDRDIRNLFLFIGADTETQWLQGCGIARDPNGFVLTGADAAAHPGLATPASLETSVPGVFAVGDVRSGSVKRASSAIGEGAAVVAQIHRHLQLHPGRVNT
jgi:thioredoxin reductase (NADPH)